MEDDAPGSPSSAEQHPTNPNEMPHLDLDCTPELPQPGEEPPRALRLLLALVRRSRASFLVLLACGSRSRRVLVPLTREPFERRDRLARECGVVFLGRERRSGGGREGLEERVRRPGRRRGRRPRGEGRLRRVVRAGLGEVGSTARRARREVGEEARRLEQVMERFVCVSTPSAHE